MRSAAGSATSWPASAPTSGTTRPRSTSGPRATWCATSSSGSRRSSPRGRTCELPAGPSVDDDPAGAWEHLQREVQAILDDPASADRVLSNRAHRRRSRCPQAVSKFFTGDVFMHTWDLARATGQDDTLDPEVCAAMLAGMEPIEDAHARQRPVRRAGRRTGRRGRADQDAGIHRPRSRVETADVCLVFARDDHADPLAGHPDRHQLEGVGAPRRPRRARRAAQAQGLRHHPEGHQRAYQRTRQPAALPRRDGPRRRAPVRRAAPAARRGRAGPWTPPSCRRCSCGTGRSPTR